MGTKNNPGAFDCYANAEPDEPMFILLGRDKHAALLVALWAALRDRAGEDGAVVREAAECATTMWLYRLAKRGEPGLDVSMEKVMALLSVAVGEARIRSREPASDARIAELLAANNAEVERRREIEAESERRGRRISDLEAELRRLNAQLREIGAIDYALSPGEAAP